MPVADYDESVTGLCERALVTVIGNAGFWSRRLYLVGGLTPRFLYPGVPNASPHVGSRDIDLAVILLVGDPTSESYETLARNLGDSGFVQSPVAGDPDFRWRRDIDGVGVVLEFICDTDEVPPGRNFKPRSGSGSRFQAFNVPGARLAERDHKLVPITAERLDGGGRATAGVRVSGLLPFVSLKIHAFVDRHHDKDAYDIIWTLLNHPDGPERAGLEMAASPVADHPFVTGALRILGERFADPGDDGPTAYASFLDLGDDRDASARLRNEAVEVVRVALLARDNAAAIASSSSS